MKVCNALSRDDTIHGVYYYLASEADDAIEKLEAERERNLQSIVDGNNIILKKNDEIAQLKAELAAMREQRPVAYWIPKAEQFCFASPTGRPFAKAWEPLYAAPGAKP